MVIRYSDDHDMIAELETKLLSICDRSDELESRKRRVENIIRMDIEIKAEDKTSGLTNEKKRQIAYEEYADENGVLQEIISELKDVKRREKVLKIEIDNDKRAFQLKINNVNQ